MTTLASKVRWTSGAPAIYLTYEYEKKRVGADMQYRAKVTVSAVTSGATFGFPIYATVTINGATAGSATIKAASPSQWSSALTYTTPWVTVANKTSGTTPISFRVYSGSGSSRNQTNAYTMAIDPAASSISAENGSLGLPQTITVTRYDPSFLDTITYACGDVSGVIAENSTASSVQFTPPHTLAAQNPTGANVAITITISTVNADGVSVGTNSIVISAEIPPGVKPVASLTLSDVTGYYERYGAYVQGMSALSVTVNAEVSEGATIQSYTIKADGKTFAAQSAVVSPINNSGRLLVTGTATDSRGRQSDPAEQYIDVLAYQAPKITQVTIIRCDENGNKDNSGGYIKVEFAASVSPLNSRNKASYTVQYKAKTEEDYNSDTLTQYDDRFTVAGEHIFAAATGVGYDVQLLVVDSFKSATRAAQASIGVPLMHFLADKSGGAIGKEAEQKGLLDIAWSMLVRGDLTVSGNLNLAGDLSKQIALAARPVGSLYWSNDPTSPEILFGGRWEQVTDTFILAAGSIYEAGTSGGSAEVTLTVDQIPSHIHRQTITAGRSGSGETYASWSAGNVFGNTDTDARNTLATGGGKAHDNMPPYIARYCWERLPDEE